MPAEGRENPLLKKGNSDAFFSEKYLTKNTQGTPSPLAPSQAASAISCMVSRILTSPGRHHSGVSLFVRRFAQKAIAVAMLKCKPLFLFIFGPIILGLIRNPIWLDSGGLASSFSCQSAERLSDSNY